MKSKRRYMMRARADATTETRRRILRAVFDLAMEKVSFEIVLDDVASRAGVSVQTILRHFGSREGLFDSAESFAIEQVEEERAAPAGDVDTALRTVFDHYERRGDVVLRFLGQEHWDDRARRVNDRGRQEHRRWVEAVFAPQLAGLSAGEAEALTDVLVVATDVYTWKLLRRDRALSREQAESRVRLMIDALLTRRKEQIR
jgi:AcrR family transcriptional regulator